MKQIHFFWSYEINTLPKTILTKIWIWLSDWKIKHEKRAEDWLVLHEYSHTGNSSQCKGTLTSRKAPFE